jgi:serine/threonine protein kinase
LHLNDFGTAKNSIMNELRENTASGTWNGTLNYLAPEILNAKKNPDMTKQDVWAIGVIAYEICNFTLPFSDSDDGTPAIIKAILEFLPKPFVNQGYSAELKGLINQLLTKDPAHRPSI